MAYTKHLNKLAATAERTPNGIRLDLSVYVYPARGKSAAHGNLSGVKGGKHTDIGVVGGDFPQLIANFSNLVGLLHRRVKA